MSQRIILLLMLLSAGILSAKPKAVSLKKFKHADIGHPALAGSSTVKDNSLIIVAGGADVWGNKDEFRYSYIEQKGDFDFTARIESLSPTHLYTKAGLMAREDLTDNCRHIYFQVFPTNNARNKNNGGYEFQYRAAKGGEMKAIYPARAEGTPDFPISYPNTWIRIQRSGDVFTGYYSPDGQSWKIYTTYTLKLPEKLYLGLAVTSHDAEKSTTAVFKEVNK
ncbi:MAG TPA: hypothetical protein VK205_07095 [Prolixibacteraceae bacterium]|nr:hypothetical protein [Prolixibacteraceae bacterium]